MPRYVYECKRHGLIEVEKAMADAGREEFCTRCLFDWAGDVSDGGGHYVEDFRLTFGPLRRVYTPLGFIMRPSGWHLRPGDRGYADFNRELELGEVRGPSHERTPVVAEEPEKPVPLVLPEDTMQEIHEFGRVVDRQIREEMPLPQAVLDLI